MIPAFAALHRSYVCARSHGSSDGPRQSRNPRPIHGESHGSSRQKWGLVALPSEVDERVGGFDLGGEARRRWPGHRFEPSLIDGLTLASGNSEDVHVHRSAGRMSYEGR